MKKPTAKEADLNEIIASPAKFKRLASTDSSFEFSVQPIWDKKKRTIDVSYSIRSTVRGLNMGAIAAGIYFQDDTKATSAVNAIPNEWNVTQINNWMVSGSYPKSEVSVVTVTVGIVVVVVVGGQMKMFPYLNDFMSGETSSKKQILLEQVDGGWISSGRRAKGGGDPVGI